MARVDLPCKSELMQLDKEAEENAVTEDSGESRVFTL